MKHLSLTLATFTLFFFCVNYAQKSEAVETLKTFTVINKTPFRVYLKLYPVLKKCLCPEEHTSPQECPAAVKPGIIPYGPLVAEPNTPKKVVLGHKLYGGKHFADAILDLRQAEKCTFFTLGTSQQAVEQPVRNNATYRVTWEKNELKVTITDETL